MRTHFFAYLIVALTAAGWGAGCASDTEASKSKNLSAKVGEVGEGDIEAEILQKDDAIFNGLENKELENELDQAMNDATKELEKDIENDIKLGDGGEDLLNEELEAEADDLEADLDEPRTSKR